MHRAPLRLHDLAFGSALRNSKSRGILFKQSESHLLYCLTPFWIHDCIGQFVVKYWRPFVKMRENALETLQNLLNDTSEARESFFRPLNSIQMSDSSGLSLGDHIAVFNGSVYHHGIYIGNEEVIYNQNYYFGDKDVSFDDLLAQQTNQVPIVFMGVFITVFGNNRTQNIKKRSLVKFLNGKTEFVMICHPYFDYDKRLHIVSLANHFQILQSRPYNIMNCEHFANLCIGNRHELNQIQKFAKLFKDGGGKATSMVQTHFKAKTQNVCIIA